MKSKERKLIEELEEALQKARELERELNNQKTNQMCCCNSCCCCPNHWCNKNPYYVLYYTPPCQPYRWDWTITETHPIITSTDFSKQTQTNRF